MSHSPPESPPANTKSSLKRGAEVIRAALKTIPSRPGIYRMLGNDGDALYIGKAKSLRQRVGNYTHISALSSRISRMVAATYRLEITVTESEAQALLLEANLIKKHQPRYNILLRDDKSFPFICLDSSHDFPRISKHRGAQKKGGEYFGPFASAGAVNQTITILQRAFLLRPCSDNIFRQRKRPCLQYQIKRCSAPCVGYIDEDEYAALVAQAREFLHGKNREMQQELAQQMQAASRRQDYEAAAVLRDRIQALTQVQQQGRIGTTSFSDGDVLALCRDGDSVCIQLLFFRGGQHFGGRSYFPANTRGRGDDEILSSFIGQFYQRHPPPKIIITSHKPEDVTVLEDALRVHSGYRVEITTPQRGEKKKLLEQARENAQIALQRRFSERASQQQILQNIADKFGLAAPPARIEVYDNSHISGSHAVGAMIVAGTEGFAKNHYRKFTIKGDDIAPGDDYAMLREVLTRRFSRLQESDSKPDLLLIDGGSGQLKIAQEVLNNYGITDIAVIAIAKGKQRNAGREQFFLPNKNKPLRLPQGDSLLHYLQRLRDEAHRFAIGAHRNKRSRAIHDSPLDAIAGIGSKRKKALLLHFGSARAIAGASVADIAQVEGINRKTAQNIYDHFHG